MNESDNMENGDFVEQEQNPVNVEPTTEAQKDEDVLAAAHQKFSRIWMERLKKMNESDNMENGDFVEQEQNPVNVEPTTEAQKDEDVLAAALKKYLDALVAMSKATPSDVLQLQQNVDDAMVEFLKAQSAYIIKKSK